MKTLDQRRLEAKAKLLEAKAELASIKAEIFRAEVASFGRESSPGRFGHLQKMGSRKVSIRKKSNR